jgi:hypothetical protein
MEKRIIPKFEIESAEARWWYENREELAQDFTNAVRQGRAGSGSVAKLRKRHLKRVQAPNDQFLLMISSLKLSKHSIRMPVFTIWSGLESSTTRCSIDFEVGQMKSGGSLQPLSRSALRFPILNPLT